MSDLKYLNFVVQCPKAPHSPKVPMQLQYVVCEDGSRTYLPCNGCDEMSGSDFCLKCCAAVTLKFHRGYLPDHNEVVYLSKEDIE